MSSPNPVPPQPPGLTPSSSTNASALGGAIAALIIFILGAKGITFPAGAEAAIAVIVTTIAGYIPKSGRQ
jgi:hypothetical protein